MYDVNIILKRAQIDYNKNWKIEEKLVYILKIY